MKISKKLLSIILAAIIAVSTVAGSGVFAIAATVGEATGDTYTSGDYTYTVTDGVAEITKYNGADSVIEIPAVRGGYTVTTIGSGAFKNNNTITEVTVPDSVVTIGADAFYGCKSLGSVSFGENLTTIGNRAFDFCISLESVKLTGNISVVGASAFSGCTSLANVIFGENLTSIGTYAFSHTLITDITLYGKLTTLGDGAFSGCEKVSNITVEKINPNYCSVDNALFDKACTTILKYASGSTNTTYTIPSTVTTIGAAAFASSPYLQSITIPSSVKTVSIGAFNSCTALKEVVISDGVQVLGPNAFLKCTSLESVSFPPSLMMIGSAAFSGCSALKKINISDISAWCSVEAEDYPTRYAGNLYLKGELVAELVIPEDVYMINPRAFDGLSCLKKVTIPENVEIIGSRAFQNCSGLETVEIGALEIGEYAFSNCSSLENVKILDSVNSVGTRAFESSSVGAATIGAKYIGEYAFYNCENLWSVTFGEGTKSVGNYAFYECGSLEKITIPANITSIGTYAFGYYYGYEGKYPAILPYSLTIYTPDSSAGHSYAKNGGFNVVILEPDYTDSVIYFAPGVEWKNNNARFALCITDDNGNSRWISMVDTDNDGVFGAELPKGNWKKVKFSRFNGNTTENISDNQLNQTGTLVLSGRFNCYVITEPWDSDGVGSGEWYKYNEETGELSSQKTEYVLKGRYNSGYYYSFSFINDKVVVKFPDGADSLRLFNQVTGNSYYVEGYSLEGCLSVDMRNLRDFGEYETPGEWSHSKGVYEFTISDKTQNYVTLTCEEVLVGDIDDSGELDIKDVTCIQKTLASMEVATRNHVVTGDMNGNGRLDIRDATLIQLELAHLK